MKIQKLPQVSATLGISIGKWNTMCNMFIKNDEPSVMLVLEASLESPFKYNGDKTDEDILEILDYGMDFSVRMIKNPMKDKNDVANFNNILKTHLKDKYGDDLHKDYLRYLDYIFCDFVLWKYNMNQT